MKSNNVDISALAQLKDAKPLLNKQQYKTLRGQILAGDPRGAIKGLGKILQRGEGGTK